MLGSALKDDADYKKKRMRLFVGFFGRGKSPVM